MHPEIRTAICGNQYFHHMTFRQAGDFIPTHRHTYDHIYQQLAGCCEIESERDGKVQMQTGDILDVPAGIAHGITAMEAGSAGQCIHICRWPDGMIVPFGYELSAYERLEVTGAM